MEKNRNGENSQNRQRRSIPAVDFSQQEEHPKKSREIAPPASSALKNGNARRQSAPKFSNNKMLKAVLRPLSSVLIGLLVVVLVSFIGFRYAVSHYFSPVDENSTQEIEVIIERNDSLGEISKKLEEAGVIRNHTVFKYYVDFSDMSSKLLAGKFTLSPSMSFDDIISILKRPSAAADTTRMTFAEGISIEGYGKLLEKENILKNSETWKDIAKTGQGYNEKYSFIQEVIDKQNSSEKKRNYILEGYLFPDTYEFYLSSSETQIIDRLIAQFDRVFTEEYRVRAQELGMSIDDVVTLASIIEKEAKTDDFKKVSAVFHNRLNSDMPLQSCATHQYFMPVKKIAYNSEELQVDSPYNTYLYGGLPAGPICNPGKAAIEAALYPDEAYLNGGYLYFCLGDPNTGETVFAQTYEEHLRNQAKYKPLWDAYDREHAS